jgi:hypothetical protein
MPFGVWLMFGALASVGIVVVSRRLGGDDAPPDFANDVERPPEMQTEYRTAMEARFRRMAFLILIGFAVLFAVLMLVIFVPRGMAYEGY